MIGGTYGSHQDAERGRAGDHDEARRNGGRDEPGACVPHTQIGSLTLSSPAGHVSPYDFTSDGAKRTRLAAALMQVRGASWFFKLTGAEESVGQSLPAFKKKYWRA